MPKPEPVEELGTIHGPERCTRRCEMCRHGYHHWNEHSDDPTEEFEDDLTRSLIRAFDEQNGTEHELAHWRCKHCTAWAEYNPGGDDDRATDAETA